MDLESVNFNLVYEWRALIGAFVGAAAPFTLWWFTELYNKTTRREEYLLYLQRHVADQMNMINDTKSYPHLNEVKAKEDSGAFSLSPGLVSPLARIPTGWEVGVRYFSLPEEIQPRPSIILTS
ncbi:MAG: hypothetical protein Q8P39_00450 [Candidatus Yanofskybacteria bacterium]|nr:hypothetical protein [Candidatus Yanofskybacteria bacterium]